ncbi:unnamed protein product [Durusdinium trenchii]|uniref:Uncharacterized protein n=1 Tax=Durusdinium trenchii TaxID=1381693 RepID=A0ABP0LXQ9_9DINO
MPRSEKSDSEYSGYTEYSDDETVRWKDWTWDDWDKSSNTWDDWKKSSHTWDSWDKSYDKWASWDKSSNTWDSWVQPGDTADADPLDIEDSWESNPWELKPAESPAELAVKEADTDLQLKSSDKTGATSSVPTVGGRKSGTKRTDPTSHDISLKPATRVKCETKSTCRKAAESKSNDIGTEPTAPSSQGQLGEESTSQSTTRSRSPRRREEHSEELVRALTRSSEDGVIGSNAVRELFDLRVQVVKLRNDRLIAVREQARQARGEPQLVFLEKQLDQKTQELALAHCKAQGWQKVSEKLKAETQESLTALLQEKEDMKTKLQEQEKLKEKDDATANLQARLTATLKEMERATSELQEQLTTTLKEKENLKAELQERLTATLKENEEEKAEIQQQLNRTLKQKDAVEAILHEELEIRKTRITYDLEREKLVSDLQTRLAAALKEQEELASEVQASSKKEKSVSQLQAQLTAALKEKEELKAQLQECVPSHVGGCGVTCQYEEHGAWLSLPPEGNHQMLQAYTAYLGDSTARFATIQSAGIARKVDFERMEQRRSDTGMVRQIRILPLVPPQWITTAASLLQQSEHVESFKVAVDDENILLKMQEILRSTAHAQACNCIRNAKVISMHRIEHGRLWHGYKTRLAALRQEHKSFNVSVAPVTLNSHGGRHLKVMN